ncbi:MAG: sulfotransferase family protein, partial [Bacteroidota bacterium]
MSSQKVAINKIFGIGLSKTGTTSLARALRILGYSTKDFPSLRYIPGAAFYIKPHQLEAYQAFTDVSIIPFYKKLDQQFPNSKFIYTIRDRESWLTSCEKYPRFQRPIYNLPLKVIKLRKSLYGTVKFNEQKFNAAYERHHQDVLDYFAERPNDLLILNICGGEQWEPLCSFLDVALPSEIFPFANARSNNY